MAYATLARLPRSAKRRLAHQALVSLFVITLFGSLLGYGLTDDGARRSILWDVGLVLGSWSVAMLIVAMLIGDRMARAITFYLLDGAAFLPAALGYLCGGAWGSWVSLGPSSAAIIAPFLVTSLVTTPLIIRSRTKWKKEAIARGYLKRALDEETATWDPRYDMDHFLKDPRIARPSFLLSLLFWSGPAIGLALADVFGTVVTGAIVGVLMAGFGFLALVAGITNCAVLLLELRRHERRLGRPILLPPEFTKGGTPARRQGE